MGSCDDTQTYVAEEQGVALKHTFGWLRRLGKAFANRWPEILLITAALVAVGYLGHGSCWGVHPSDRSMIAMFREHQAEFQAVADAELGQSRRVKGSVPGVQDIYPVPGGVEFVVSTEGAMMVGSRKGYLYSPEAPENLPNAWEAPDGHLGGTYRKIEDDWYIFYEWER